MIDAIEAYRRRSMRRLFEVRSFASCWPTWRREINAFTVGMTDARNVFELGGELARIFQTTGDGGRGQDALSGGGTAWECLVCWYLNIVLAGSRAVAMRPLNDLLPAPVRDAMCIVYGNAQTNTEADLVTIVLPRGSGSGMASVEGISGLVAGNCHEVTVGVVQCKTNWNDNAQIPMLWDMVYRAKGFLEHSVRVGRNGFSPRHFKEFSYSFVTVPSQRDLGKFTPRSMAVKRVRGLTGGNYWGHPTRSDVALSLGEIFNRNFSDAFDTNILAHIKRSIDRGLISTEPIR